MFTEMEIFVREEVLRPYRGNPADAGLDLKVDRDIIVPALGTAKCGTGVYVNIPTGYVGLVVPRSSSTKTRVVLDNLVGVIDAGYVGEIKLVLHNQGIETQSFYKGDRVVQFIVVPVALYKEKYVSDPSAFTNVASDRGDGGFGSTNEKKPGS